MPNIIDDVKELLPEAIEIRRYLHRYPELSSQEFKTATYLKNQIKDMGLPIVDVEETGFYVVLDTGREGKSIGLRTDIDALPIEESPRNLKNLKKVISENPGVSHACGHDAHMAILLSSMKLLVKYKKHLKGKIIFIFEEGEEIGAGIDAMIEALKNEEIDAIYGNHLRSSMDVGTISADAGPVMAGVGKVEFKVIGQSGHGSRPDLAVNPIFGAVQVLSGISSAWNNRLDPNRTTTLGITQIHGGAANNIIPDDVSIGGTLRYFDEDEGKKAMRVLYDVATKTASAHQCSIEILEEKTMIPLINDENLAELAHDGINQLLPGSLVENENWFGSEPFSKYRTIAPILFTFIGIKNDELGSGAEHHTHDFDIDENSLYYGITTMVKFTLDYLNGKISNDK